MLNDIAKQVQDQKDQATKVLGVVNTLKRGISQAVRACHKADDLADKAAKAAVAQDSSFQNVAREFMELGVSLSDFDNCSEAREAYRLIVIDAYYGEKSQQKKLFYSDVDTLTDSQAEKREVVRVKTNNVITQQRLQWQFCIDRDGMFEEHGTKVEAWKQQNAADPDFATAVDDNGKLVNPLPIWEEPSRAAATRWRNEREERSRDTAYHAKRAIKAAETLSELASDPDLIPLELEESKQVQEHLAAIVTIFNRYAAKDSDEG